MISQTTLQQLVLEALEELKLDLEKKQEGNKDPRDYRTDPLYLPKKDMYLLFDDENPSEDENVNILELGATLEDGSPVCEGCLVAYMNENYKLLTEAEYHGRKVKLGVPMPNDPDEKKKSKVYVRDPKTGNVKKVTFGDRNMRIKKSNPKRRKSFRARHNCANPGPRTKAKYWSCRAWE